MREIILIVHIIIAALLISSVLVQQTSQTGLGLGGAPSTSNDLARLLEGRAASNFFSQSTTILGTAFFATSIALALFMSAGTSTSLLGRFFAESRPPSSSLIERADANLQAQDASRAAEAGAANLQSQSGAQ